MMSRLLSVAVLGLCATGCLTVGSMQTASTLGRGNIQGGVASELWGTIITDSRLLSPGVNTFNVLPSVSGVLRFGVSDVVDLGLRAGFNSIELQGKIQFLDTEQFAVSVAPAVTGFYIPSINDGMGTVTKNTGVVAIPVPVLFGIKIGNHELVFAAREVNQIIFLRDPYAGAPLQTGFELLLGLSAGIALRLSDSFVLMPEIAAQLPLFVSVFTPFGSGSALGNPGVFQLTAGVGCLFGRMKPRIGVAPPPAEEPPMYAPPMESPPPVQPPPPGNELPPDVAPPPPPPPPPSAS